jgi:predicted nucleotidyltransferase
MTGLANIPQLGMIIPVMGTKSRSSHGLADALFSPVQQRVLGLLYGQPQRRFQSAELIRLAGSGTGAAHRLLTRLAEAGIVTVTRSGNQKHYQANRASPIFTELHRLVVKTVGVVGPLRRALAPFEKRIVAAFVYGSVAKRTDTSSSDIDVMVISDSVTYPDLFRALEATERVLARPVSPNVMTRAEWRAKRGQSGSFASRVSKQPQLFLIGSDDDIA